jgi:transposase-like protein
MKHYPKKRKDAVIAKMANHPSLPQLAKQEGISLPTLYAWRRKAREQGVLMPSSDDSPDGWNSVDKFNTVLQTASMNEAQIAEFCRANGLYPEQIQRWKSACQNANDWDQQRSSELEKARRQEQSQLKKIQAELRRKEKALAEAAALLVLQKKFNALFEDGEV